MRKFLTLAVVLSGMLLGAIVPSPSIAGVPVDVGTIGPDESVFWAGGYVGSSPAYSAPAAPSLPVDRCDLGQPCFVYRLNVNGSGQVLRIAFDTPMRDDNFEISITSPTGAVVKRTNSNQYSIEALILAPPQGTWTIEVAPYSAEYAEFRMRAKLESAPYQPSETGPLAPNLRVTRIWEFGFVAPANPLNGLFPPDDANPPLDVAGQHPASCAADEVADGARRCLRYSFGLANVGLGTFDIRFSGDRSGTEFDMIQCVQQSSGPPVPRAAGKGHFHTTHGHFHYKDIIYHELFKVADMQTGTLVSAGGGKKLGYSPADQAIAEWDRFVQAPSGTSGAFGNCAPGNSSRLGMSRGWGDAYRYQRPGNFVEFGDNGDGWYVVRTVADPENVVLETDETDNTSYALIRVVGEDVNVVEMGRGQSPWDPNKVVIP